MALAGRGIEITNVAEGLSINELHSRGGSVVSMNRLHGADETELPAHMVARLAAMAWVSILCFAKRHSDFLVGACIGAGVGIVLIPILYFVLRHEVENWLVWFVGDMVAGIRQLLQALEKM